ncbi:type II toxin-antitoxin system HicB family antitoxin [Alkalicaulis satelles]|uniref:Type II toxin-antitoxin system HicB family antitoxin n=1 Tax=Alkalicaulis satelles TaxID=2609175 RepID=A0A5M6ZFI8_9PROT|nr:type II toxin-antitoxin system HicB family antitoxin [Alkalicaulis satelles]KAA5801001.1 type II toxin-antitoxin system HicB family antitoxin [Alkalicaulis satelles]
MSEHLVYAYPVSLEPDEDGRVMAFSADFPELATDGADEAEALANAADALDVVLRERLRRGEEIPDPRPPGDGECSVAVVHVTAYRIVLSQWAHDHGRGAQIELARRLGKGETHVRRLLSPEGGARVESLVEALRALGWSPAPSIALTPERRAPAGETRRAS